MTDITTDNTEVRWSRVIPVVLGGVVSHAFGRSTLQTLLPAIADEIGLGPQVEGYLGTTGFGCYFLGVIIVTFVAAKLDPFTLLRGGIAIIAVGLTVLTFASSAWMLFVGVGLTGLGGPGVWLTMPALVAASAPPARRGAVMGSLTATMGVAFIVVPAATILMRRLADDNGVWRPIWLTGVVFSLGLLLYLSVFFERPAVPSETRSVGMKPLFALSMWKPAVTTYMAFAFIASSYGLFLGRMLEDDSGFGRTFTTMMFTVMGFGSIAGALGFGRLSDRLGRPRVMMIVLWLMAVALVGLTADNTALVVGSVLLVGSCSASIPSLIAAYTRDQSGDQNFTAVFGAMTIFYGPATMLGPFVGGQLGNSAGSFTSFYVLLAAMSLVASFSAWRLSHNR